MRSNMVATRKLAVLKSNEDDSVNFVESGTYPGSIESRYVRRAPDYFIIYLSSQTGCNKACRFCHLTQTGQTDFTQLGVESFLRQADEVFAYADTQPAAKIVHFDFMARGEALANPTMLDFGDDVLAKLADRALARNLLPRYKVSTIMPLEMKDRELSDVFRRYTPDIHYSLYSVNPAFRKRWMPKAMEPKDALWKLHVWQRRTSKIVKLHWAYIEGENDSVEDTEQLAQAVRDFGLRCDINIVRYNSYSDGQGKEPPLDVIMRNADLLSTRLPEARVKIVARVGFDVKASCGMFVG